MFITYYYYLIQTISHFFFLHMFENNLKKKLIDLIVHNYFLTHSSRLVTVLVV